MCTCTSTRARAGKSRSPSASTLRTGQETHKELGGIRVFCTTSLLRCRRCLKARGAAGKTRGTTLRQPFSPAVTLRCHAAVKLPRPVHWSVTHSLAFCSRTHAHTHTHSHTHIRYIQPALAANALLLLYSRLVGRRYQYSAGAA
jgi:hypothetical protein